MKGFLVSVQIALVALSAVLLLTTWADFQDYKREAEAIIEIKNDEIVKLQKEIRYLKTDIYILKNGFEEN